MTNHTDTPQFAEPDYSYKFEELSPEQRDNFYKRKYKTTMTTKEVLRVSGIGFLALCGLILIGGMLVRLIVQLAVWGYTLFGVI